MHPTTHVARTIHAIVIAALLLVPGLFGAVQVARGAATLVVNTFADDNTVNGNCSLREAIQAANTRATVDGCDPSGILAGQPVPIALQAGTYRLTTGGDLSITGDLTLTGAGAGVTTIDATGLGARVVTAQAGATVAIAGATISGGTTAGGGGGISNSGTLTLDAVRVTRNSATVGGGIANAGAITITRSAVDTNRATVSGGGLLSSAGAGGNATAAVTRSTIAGNTVGAAGGTIFEGNRFGGGIYNAGNSRITITNSTISDNRASDDGAGLYNNNGNIPSSSNLVTLANVTISHNSAVSQAGGVDNFGALELHDTIIARNVGPQGDPDCRTLFGFSFTSQGYNLIQTISPQCVLVGTTTGNITGQDPLLGPLRDNGGPTLTRTLASGSPAIDVGDPGNPLTTDQRGSLRPVNGRADIGAYEVGGVTNDSWPTAQRVNATLAEVVTQTLDRPGQARWYKFQVSPNSKVTVQLTNLPANYDLTLYKDIAGAFTQITSARDLLHLGAEFAADAFNPDTFSPDTFSPDTFSPDTFSPDTFSPDTFSPDTFSPDTFSPDTFSPDTFSPDTFSPDTFSPDTFSSAQTRSLLAVSAFEGLVSEGIRANTWLSSGDFYVRVRGREGIFNPATPFRLQVTLLPGSCGTLNPAQPSTTPTPGGYRTLILADSGRMPAGTARDTMLATIRNFAARQEIQGKVVDFANDAGIGAGNAQADGAVDCPYAKNLVAGAIKEVIDGYRAANPALEYLVIVGNDGVIPFFRHPDQSLIGNERDFVPPVLDRSASQASLRTGYFLSQDRYGAQTEVSLRSGTLPLPDLALGRLVESPQEITAQFDLYIATGGAALRPRSSLVTGYDFLADVAGAVQGKFAQGTGQAPDTLIAARGISPLDPQSWTADQLRAKLLGQRHDLIFLAGHFSAGSALAADFSSRLLASELAASPVDLTNTLVLSAGCHAGYNLVDDDAVPGVTASPDWPQAFARKRAILIAGTGYQYGDTDFIEYSERLYLDFSEQLRAGSGPLAVGKVLAAAKQQYLTEVPSITGLHEKAFLEATLFGLPMVRVDLSGGRGTPPTPPSIVTGTTGYGTGPGAVLNLQRADVSVPTSTQPHSVTLNTTTGGTLTATYLSGPNGVVTNPAQPVLPLDVRNVSVPDTVLRGVGFRGGLYTDLPGILPLTGAPTTEVRGVKVPFYSDVFYPAQPYRANYLGALTDAGGATQLMLTPAQYRSASPGAQTGTLRQFRDLDFRLFYSGDTSPAALTTAPTITRVTDFVAGGKLTVTVATQGASTAGVQEVWITYTASGGPFAGRWQSLDLTPDTLNPDLWQGTLDLQGTAPADLRYLVQAASGVGLVTMLTNQGAYYTPAGDTTTVPPPPQSTTLTIRAPAAGASAPFGTDVRVTAQLQDTASRPVANQPVTLAIGGQSRRVITNASGVASASIRLLALPGDYDVRASFAGTTALAPASDARPFAVAKQATQLNLSATPVQLGGTATVRATLTDALGNPLGLRTIFVTATGGATGTVAATTDFAGRAVIAYPNVAAGFSVAASFGGGQQDQPADERYLASTAATTIIAYQQTQFVIWGGNPGGVAIGKSYQFWGAQWGKQITGGNYQANGSFKGYADNLTADGRSWTTSTGGSGHPPATVAQYISVLVSTSITKNSSTISGNVTQVVILRVAAPQTYQPDLDHPGTGVLVATLP